MLYALLCYNSEEIVGSWSKEEDDEVMARLEVVNDRLPGEGQARPDGAAHAHHRGDDAAQDPRAPAGAEQRAADGDRRPFAETKEQLLGFYVVDCAIAGRGAGDRARAGAWPTPAAPTRSGRSRCSCRAGVSGDRRRPGSTRRCGRPGRSAMGALLRYFRDLDAAEEAFQDACLAALKNWPQNGPPRDPAAWLIFVGRNAARRRRAPPQQAGGAARRRRSCCANCDDAGDPRRRWPSGSTARTTATTSCACCSSAATRTCRRRSRSRSRCASSAGCRSSEIARAFLVGESGDGAADHARQEPRRRRRRSVRDAGRARARAERLAAVAAVIYLMFNEGYSATGGDAHDPRAAVRRGDPPRAPAAAPVPRRARDDGPAGADAAAARARAGAARRRRRHRAARGPGPQPAGTATFIAEGLALLDKAMRHRRPGPYQVQAAIARACTRGAARAEETDWAQIDRLYATLERLPPSPVVTLNRAVAVSKVRGPAAALEMIEPLGAAAVNGYFHFFGLRGRAAAAARPRRRGARRVRPRHRARAHAGRGGAHPHAPRSPGTSSEPPAPRDRGRAQAAARSRAAAARARCASAPRRARTRARASSRRPSLASRSPRTLGSR